MRWGGPDSWLTPASGAAVRPTPESYDLYPLTPLGLSGPLLTLLAMTGVGSKLCSVVVDLRIGRFIVVVTLL